MRDDINFKINLYSVSYSIWDYIGTSIMLGPLIIAVLSLLGFFISTAYEEYTSKPPITFLNHYTIPRNIIVKATITISLMVTSAGVLLYQNPSLIPPFFRSTSTSEVTLEGEVKIGVYWGVEGMRKVKNIDWDLFSYNDCVIVFADVNAHRGLTNGNVGSHHIVTATGEKAVDGFD